MKLFLLRLSFKVIVKWRNSNRHEGRSPVKMKGRKSEWTEALWVRERTRHGGEDGQDFNSTTEMKNPKSRSGRAKLVVLTVGILLQFQGCGPGTFTSADASVDEVKFLNLPNDATEIRFWTNGLMEFACFKIGEEEFVKAVGSIATFKEISSPVGYVTDGFGDLHRDPYEAGKWVDATHGLVSEKIEPNGGGHLILYDRDRGQGFYSWRAR